MARYVDHFSLPLEYVQIGSCHIHAPAMCTAFTHIEPLLYFSLNSAPEIGSHGIIM